MSVINSERITYYGYTYPIWSTVAGWLFTLSSMSAIPIYAIYYYFKQKFSSSKTSNHVTLNMSNLNGKCMWVSSLSCRSLIGAFSSIRS